MRALRRFLILLLVAAVIFLIGGGRDWFGKGEVAKPQPDAEQQRQVASSSGAGRTDQAARPPAGDGTPNGREATQLGPTRDSGPPDSGLPDSGPTDSAPTQAGPTQAGAGRPEAAQSQGHPEARPSPTPVTGLSASELDRRLGRLHQADQALQKGRIASALQALEQLEKDGMLESMLLRFAGLRNRARQDLAKALQSMAAHIKQGEVLQAREIYQRVRLPAVGFVDDALQEFCRRQGWPALEGSIATLAEALNLPESSSATFATGQMVRMRGPDGWQEAVLHQVSGERLTLRVEQAGGVRYPVADRLNVEVLAASSQQALAQAKLAADRKDRTMARLWLSCCLSHDDGLARRVRAALPKPFVGR